MSYLYKKQPLCEGYNLIVSPDNSPMKWLELGRLILSPGNTRQFETGENEMAMSIFRGRASVNVEAEGCARVSLADWGRIDPFSQMSQWVYAPRGSKVSVSAATSIDVGVFQATARKDTAPRIIDGSEIEVRKVGKDNCRRVVNIVPREAIKADRLIVGETICEEGNWSSFPPHKHDTYVGETEMPFEEIYFYLVDPPQGFGIQRVYTKPGEDPDGDGLVDEACTVRDGDAVVVPKGYHPVIAAGGCRLFYFWALAGDVCKYGMCSEDPDFRWLSSPD